MAITTAHMKAFGSRVLPDANEAASSAPVSIWRDRAGGAGLGGWLAADACRASGELVLTNARLVTRSDVFSGTLHVVQGRIVDIDTRRSGVQAAIDLAGDFLVPGLIDIHTDYLERHLEPRPGVAWPSLMALIAHDRQVAAAGVTTVFDSLCVGDRMAGRVRDRESLTGSLEALELAQLDGLLKAHHFLHLRCEVSADDVVETFAGLVDHPLARLVSLMDHTPGQRQWRNLAKWRKVTSRDLDPGEDLDSILKRRTSVPPEVSAAARFAVAELCHERGLALASHDDTTAEHIAEAVANGATISEFPTTALAARLARDAGMQVVMGAPNVVIGHSHSGNASARELAAQGLVDGLASDYVPVSLLQASFVLHQELGIDLARAVATITAKPAAMLGLSDRGEIAQGARADLVRVRLCRQAPIVREVWREGVRVA